MAYKEIDETEQNKSVAKIIFRIVIAVALALNLLVALISQHPTVKREAARKKLFSQYDQTVEMALGGQYSEAEELFLKMKDEKDNYKDVNALIEYCRANIAFNENRENYNYAPYLNSKCNDLTTEQKEKFEAFKYEIIDIDKSQKTTHEEEIRLSRNSYYPYMDMPERLMRDTVLNSYLKGFYIGVINNDEQGNDCNKRQNIYEFKIYKGKIYTVKCTDGKVSSIDTFGFKDAINGDNSDETTTNAPAEINGLLGSNDDTPDEATKNEPYTVESHQDYYHVKEFEDPDDFYYYYKEDFESYEDAEDYFNKHR